MAHLVLVRHGEPDYSGVTARGYIGHGQDLAPLTEAGIAQAEAAAGDARLSGASLIVSSPYTRALQTAAVISRKTGIPIRVELGLHEWIIDTSYRFASHEYTAGALEECVRCLGVQGEGTQYRWEPLEDVAKRAYAALYPYESEEKLIVVSHGIVMRQFVCRERIPYCGIEETDFDRNFRWPGFREEAYRVFRRKL